MSGWWFQPIPLKNDGVSSSVGMIIRFPIPNMIGKVIIQPCSSHHQMSNTFMELNKIRCELCEHEGFLNRGTPRFHPS